MKKSNIIFVMATVISVGMIAYGWAFVDGQIGEVSLTEETVMGDSAAAEGLTVGFRADSADDLHWVSTFDFSTHETKSSFKRGEMAEESDTYADDDIRFTGESTLPFSTRLEYDGLEGLQEKEIHDFYDEVQQKVSETGLAGEGKIRLKDYLDYYPVSFRFQMGNRIYNSDDALTGLKIYDELEMLSPEKASAYAADVDLYTAFNNLFRIPVIDNEYQEYRVSKAEDYDEKTSLSYETVIEKPLGEGEDFYEFEPMLVIQEENIMDGKRWYHPDLSGGLSYDAEEQSDNSYVGKTASEYDLKNRMLFIVNNRTAKGEAVDVSHISGGYGVYELPIEVASTATVKMGKKSYTLPDPKPLSHELSMVYPLDEEAEYVEMSLSGDHRYLAVFSVKDGDCFVEMIDADNWTSHGAVRVFPSSEKLTFAWSEDGSLTLTNHRDYAAVICRTGNDEEPYEVLYSGKIPEEMDEAFFDRGLALAVKDGKAALVQNMLIGDAELNIRNAALECAVIDKSGVIYRGRLKSNIADFEYGMSRERIHNITSISGNASKWVIEPVRGENRCRWKTK